MFTKIKEILITVIFMNVKIIRCHYLEAEINYHKPKLERNNILNKGVWVRNIINENLYEKARLGDFIFRENSLDVDNLLQNNFDAFGANYMQDTPIVSTYVERQKRSGRIPRHKRLRKSVANKNNEGVKVIDYDNTDFAKSKIINNIKPTSIFNDYPYQVAVLLNSNKNGLDKTIFDKSKETNEFTAKNKNQKTITIDAAINRSNNTLMNVTSPKRSMKYDYETEIIKKIELTEDLNKTEEIREKENMNDSKVNDRNVFDKDNSEWHQNAPIPDISVYKVVPKEPIQKSKPVTERGLIKVISMLTKTFKKIMRQHTEIKEIQNKINEINEEFNKNSASLTSKFQDFDLKYLYTVKFHDKLKEFDAKLIYKDEYFKNKEKEISRNLKEFENQQKKFMQQQKQFYNIQKLMLSQNEKINLKQNLIAKTQSEISHRQNNFARILKKAKQLYIESRNPAITKLSSSISKAKETQKSLEPNSKHNPASQHPETTTDSIKINLFTIPTASKIQTSPDELLLKEKDDQAIDDLVYKYYFNNTFIDNFMKSKILNSFMSNAENTGSIRNVKNKRNGFETTILLPIIESNESNINHNRERRWISHHSKHKRRYHGKVPLTKSFNETVEKHGTDNENPKHPINIPSRVKNNNVKHDPFLIMAKNFCNEIHQNLNQQSLRWCIEKALRRLQFIDTKMISPPVSASSNTILKVINESRKTIAKNINVVPLLNEKMKQDDQSEIQNIVPTDSAISSSTNKIIGSSPIIMTSPTVLNSNAMYSNSRSQSSVSPDTLNFPDNEELESNLKQFDITPDTEGNIYYEGSIHSSDFMLDTESQGVDDIMPGLDSNSRMKVDPMTFAVQSNRRALVKKLNERIKMSLG